MRRTLFAILTFSILALPTLLSPTTTYAQKCAAEGGRCIDNIYICDITERELPGDNLCVNQKCCVSGGPACELSGGDLGINTAIGCIPVSDINETASFFLGWGTGIAGGIALILIIYASYMITMSSGDPKKMQAGKELLTAAIAGLLFLIFGVFALRIVGVEVMGIPGL